MINHRYKKSVSSTFCALNYKNIKNIDKIWLVELHRLFLKIMELETYFLFHMYEMLKIFSNNQFINVISIDNQPIYNILNSTNKWKFDKYRSFLIFQVKYLWLYINFKLNNYWVKKTSIVFINSSYIRKISIENDLLNQWI